MATIVGQKARQNAPLLFNEQASHVTLTGGAITLIGVRWAAWLIAAAYVLWGPPVPVYTDREPELLILALVQTSAVTAYPLLLRPRILAARPRLGNESRDLLVLGIIDFALAMGLLYLSGGWGSPFFHFAITALVVPAFLTRPAMSALLVAAFGAGYLVVLATAGQGLDGDWTDSARTQVFAHLVTAAMVIGAVQLLAYLTRQLETERDEKEVLAAQEERARIAREIHDGVAQSIYMLSLNLDKLTEDADQSTKSKLRRLSVLAKECLLEVRQYIFDLRPLLSGEAELGEALRSQIREFQAISGLEVALDVRGERRPIPIGIATAAYRVAQEALANAFRHADASRLTAVLDYRDGRLLLSIEDDGIGMAPEPEPGNGLRNMRERVESYGGTLDMRSRPSSGTQIEAVFPLEG